MLFAFHPESAFGEFFSDHYRACLILSSTVLLTAFLLLSSPLLLLLLHSLLTWANTSVSVCPNRGHTNANDELWLHLSADTAASHLGCCCFDDYNNFCYLYYSCLPCLLVPFFHTTFCHIIRRCFYFCNTCTLRCSKLIFFAYSITFSNWCSNCIEQLANMKQTSLTVSTFINKAFCN